MFVSGVVQYANSSYTAVSPGAIQEALANASAYTDERLSILISYAGSKRTEVALTGDSNFVQVRIKALRLVSPAAAVPVAQSKVKSEDL